MTIAIVAVVLAASIGLALWAGRGRRGAGISDFLVGGRTFPGWLVYFLAVGEVYSIGALIGLPSGIYSGGAGYGIWFLGYILLAYALGYFFAPLVWRAAHRYDAMTVPDVFGAHYRSRTLELVTCLTMLIALIPWGQYQFIGLQIVLRNLGLNLGPVQSVVLAGLIAFGYIAVSGIRSPAFVSILKDTLMLLAVVAVGIAAVLAAGGNVHAAGTGAAHAAKTTIGGSELTFTLTTILFQGVVFYLGFGASYIFPARSERAIKRSTVWMPLYMLIFPFVVLAAYYGLAAHPNLSDPNAVFMVTARGLLPDGLLGIVAAGASLSGLLVLAATALAIGGMISRNLVGNLAPSVQRRWTVVAVAVFLVLGATLTLVASTLMLTVLNLTYNLLAQVVPAWLAVLFARRVRTAAVVAGMLVGGVCAIALYFTGVSFGGVNPGLVSMALNGLVVFGVSAVAPGRRRQPVARSGDEQGEHVAEHAVPRTR